MAATDSPPSRELSSGSFAEAVHRISLPTGPEGWLRYLYTNPSVVRPIALALDFSAKRSRFFTRRQAGLFPIEVRRLLKDGVLHQNGDQLTLVDLAGLQPAMQMYVAQVQQSRRASRPNNPDIVPLPPDIPRNLFDPIVGFESQKVRALCVLSTSRVHAALIGPRGSAKSLMLDLIATLPRAKRVEAGKGLLSAAGLRNLLMTERPRFLLIDEAEKSAPDELGLLYGLCTRQELSVNLNGINTSEKFDVQVIVAGNEIEEMWTEALLSRFEKIRFHRYTPEEFRRVSYSVMVHEGIEPSLARFISRELSTRTGDVREAVRIAEMSHGRLDLARFHIQMQDGPSD